MDPYQSLREVIAWTAVICAGLSFLAFFAFSIWRLSGADGVTSSRSLSRRASAIAPSAPAEQVAELAKALALLTDSLAKAGPALWSLIGAALFLLIACLATGAITGGATAGGAATAAPPVAAGPGEAAAGGAATASGNLKVVPK